MVLARVQIHRMNAPRSFQQIVQNIVTGTGNGEDDVVFLDVEELAVDFRIFPVKGVDIFTAELLMLLKEVVVVDAPVVLLVKCSRKREIGAQVDYGGFVGF